MRDGGEGGGGESWEEETAGKGDGRKIGRRKRRKRRENARGSRVIRQDKCTAAKKRRRRSAGGEGSKVTRERADVQRKAEENLEKLVRVVSAERERPKEKSRERERGGGGGGKEGEGREGKRREQKEGERRAGSCWARAASDLLRRDHRTPGVATALPASLPPHDMLSSALPHTTLAHPPLSLSVAVHILRVLYFFFVSLVCLPPSCLPDTSKETRTARRDGLYEISSTSCVPLISLSLSLFPLSSPSTPLPLLPFFYTLLLPYLRCLVLFVSPDPSSCLLLQCVTKNRAVGCDI